MNKVTQWFKGLNRATKIAVVSVIALPTLALAATIPSSQTVNTVKPTVQPKVEVKQVVEKQAVPFETQTTEDGNLAKGQTQVRQEGVNGIKELTYQVTYTNDIETSRSGPTENITLQPVNKIVANGTYVAPPPQVDPPMTPGDGATAMCNDGTYSYAANHRGACSHHGGVSIWYK